MSAKTQWLNSGGEMKTKKTKKTKKQILEAECDKLWSQCIIARDRTCRGSNSSDRLSAHHIRSRTHRSTRWDLDNGLCLSWKVHFLQKANPERFQDLIINIIGDEKYQALKRKALSLWITRLPTWRINGMNCGRS